MKNPRSETIVVTPQMAENWLSHSVYERQRGRAEWHVQRLATEIKKGRFIPGTQIHFGVLGGVLKLVNGQHTLAAIVRSEIPVALTILYTPVEGEEELGQLYGRHDRHRGRTPHDVFLGMGLAEKLDLSEPEVNAFGRAIKHILADFRRLSVTNDAELAMSLDHSAAHMHDWAPHAREYFVRAREAQVGMKAAYRRAPVVAVGLVTFEAQPEKAAEFWEGAMANDGLVKYDPRQALNAFLISNSSGHGNPITYIRNVAKCWNRFYENGEIQVLRPDDAGKVGVTIRGTNYKAEAPKRAIPVRSPRPTQMTFGEHPQVQA